MSERFTGRARRVAVLAQDESGLFIGAPDLAERSEEIMHEEFAKRADADR